MTHYILINAETRAPVPLPFETESVDGYPIKITDFRDLGFDSGHEGWVITTAGWRYPKSFGLAIITEADFMAERGWLRSRDAQL